MSHGHILLQNYRPVTPSMKLAIRVALDTFGLFVGLTVVALPVALPFLTLPLEIPLLVILLPV